jgi:hypothetical protein
MRNTKPITDLATLAELMAGLETIPEEERSPEIYDSIARLISREVRNEYIAVAVEVLGDDDGQMVMSYLLARGMGLRVYPAEEGDGTDGLPWLLIDKDGIER